MAAGSQSKKARYDQYSNNIPRSIGSGSPQTPTNEFVLPPNDKVWQKLKIILVVPMLMEVEEKKL